MTSTVIVAGARTPVTRFMGSFATLSAPVLGGHAIAGALRRSGVAADRIDQVIMGEILSAGVGQGPARQAALAGGIGYAVPTMTINKLCLSGLTAVALADQMIRAGEATCVVAGGMESMSRAPHLLPRSPRGPGLGTVELLDHLMHDGLWDTVTDQAMGQLTEQYNREDTAGTFTREEQDSFAVRSHHRAAAARAAGALAAEIVPVSVKEGLTVEEDEGIRPDTTLEALARLRPVFGPDGTITAGSASQISDGAAAMVVMDKSVAEAAGLPWLAEIVGYGTVAGPDTTLQGQPSGAIRKACVRSGIAVQDLDLVEVNEAFASVALATIRDLALDPEIVNVNGGAIAIGHPVGASGARVTLHLAMELQRRGGGIGAAALCGGGGQGDALLLKVPAV